MVRHLVLLAVIAVALIGCSPPTPTQTAVPPTATATARPTVTAVPTSTMEPDGSQAHPWPIDAEVTISFSPSNRVLKPQIVALRAGSDVRSFLEELVGKPVEPDPGEVFVMFEAKVSSDSPESLKPLRLQPPDWGIVVDGVMHRGSEDGSAVFGDSAFSFDLEPQSTRSGWVVISMPSSRTYQPVFFPDANNGNGAAWYEPIAPFGTLPEIIPASAPTAIKPLSRATDPPRAPAAAPARPAYLDLDPRGDRNCNEFPGQAAAQAYWDEWRGKGESNPGRLDGDSDGIVCEAEATPEPTPIPAAPSIACSGSKRCKDFSSQAAAQAYWEACGRPGDMDRDGDGRICESLP